MSLKQDFTTYIHTLQDRICQKIEELDGMATFQEDKWGKTWRGRRQNKSTRIGESL